MQRRVCSSPSLKVFSSICRLMVSVSGTTCPDASRTWVDRPRMFSGAPLTNRILLSGEVFGATRTLMDLRSRENSRVAFFSCNEAQYLLTANTRLLGLALRRALFSDGSGCPIFSVSTTSATSVGSPIFSKVSVFGLCCRLESLQTEAIFATSARFPNPAGWGIRAPFSRISPTGANVVPSTSNSLNEATPAVETVSMTTTLLTDIWFVVRVPVLSEQMMEVHPRVSTEGRDLTMALRRAILTVPSAKQVVTTAGRPSGIAATARATAILK
mmetsp:Transcript_13912/g.22987  ORF Transcript_13912/g.22987 Transcript_13912/m.22987 type:complete len:271 (+) Transcript_13912:767-1579(+)